MGRVSEPPESVGFLAVCTEHAAHPSQLFVPSGVSLGVHVGDQIYLVILTVGLRSNSRYSSTGSHLENRPCPVRTALLVGADIQVEADQRAKPRILEDSARFGQCRRSGASGSNSL